MKRIILGITGASGSLYVPPFVRLMVDAGIEVHGIVSRAGRQVVALELKQAPEEIAGVFAWHDVDDVAAMPASGSAEFDAMVVLPCTAGSLAAIAAGISHNLLHRAADVTLKERRPLLLALRETPLNRTHLSNMLTAHDAGATLVPAMPSFYQHPADFTEMAENFAARLADLLGVSISGVRRWQGAPRYLSGGKTC